MKYLARLKSAKGLPSELPKLPKGNTQIEDELPKVTYGSFGRSEGKNFPANLSPVPQPYLEGDGSLVIPFGSSTRYHWWSGGQSVSETIQEVGMFG